MRATEFNPIFETIPDKKYKAFEIIASKARYYLGYHEKGGDLLAILEKGYNFDPMLKKLFNVAAIALLENNASIYFVDDSIDMISSNIFSKNAIEIYKPIREESESYNVDIYKEVSNVLGRYLVLWGLRDGYRYEREVIIKSFKEVVIKVLKDIDNTNIKVLKNLTFAQLNDELCKNSPEQFYEKLSFSWSKILSSEGSAENLDALRETYKIKGNEIFEVALAFCDIQIFEDKAAYLIGSHFKEIANGLESDAGVRHQDSQYLQPLVEHIELYLYPKFDECIQDKCRESEAYSCEFTGDDLYITLNSLHDEL